MHSLRSGQNCRAIRCLHHFGSKIRALRAYRDKEPALAESEGVPRVENDPAGCWLGAFSFGSRTSIPGKVPGRDRLRNLGPAIYLLSPRPGWPRSSSSSKLKAQHGIDVATRICRSHAREMGSALVRSHRWCRGAEDYTPPVTPAETCTPTSRTIASNIFMPCHGRGGMRRLALRRREGVRAPR